MKTPTAEEIAFPSLTYRTEDGVSMTMLRPYWRERPQIAQPIPGTEVAVAAWCDGTIAPVPRGADASTLAAYYLGALTAAIAREITGGTPGGRP